MTSPNLEVRSLKTLGRWLVIGVILALTSFSLNTNALAETKRLPQSQQEIQLSYAPLVKAAAPAVVNIFTTKTVKQTTRRGLFNDPFFEQFFGPGFGRPKQKQKKQNSLGSGVIVKSDGVVVTNYHVIAGADQITVALNDRREFVATILLEDEQTDLAILKIDPEGEALPFLEFHNSDDLEVGDLVIAIGNPFGVGQSVTSGIVSALGRTTGAAADIESFIQTDAAINPGNSGGALLTMRGTLAGINSAIFSKGGGSLGIGFAIPANLVQSVIQNGLATGKVVRPWLGAKGQTLNPDMARSLGLERPQGVLISDIYEGSAADLGGLLPNDIIIAVDENEILDEQSLLFRISSGIVGEVASLQVIRSGEITELTLPLSVAPENPERNLTLLDGRQPLSGATVGTLSPAFAIELGVSPFSEGVIVSSVKRGSFSARHRIKPKDIIIDVNGETITDGPQLQNLLSTAEAGWDITIRRNGRLASLRLQK